jgi:DNA segregation ATPase FtsK/SpoIIIE-like protein
MPHMIVVGRPGAAKACAERLLVSILFKATPDRVQAAARRFNALNCHLRHLPHLVDPW